MTKKNDETPEIVTPTYRGPDRRKPRAGNGESKPKARVWFDAWGNAILGCPDDTPKRRDTLNYLGALDSGSGSLEDD